MRMEYGRFRKWFKEVPAFSTQDAAILSAQSPPVVAVSLNRWVYSGRIERLRRGLYTLNEDDRNVSIDNALVASLLVEPSYLSGVWALSNYSIIPESVFTVTSATKGRHLDFKNSFGNFSYYRLPERAWFGFKEVKVGGGLVLLADPEKALLDTLYWSRAIWTVDRFRQERVDAARIQPKRLMSYLQKWPIPMLQKSVAAFSQYKEQKCQTW